MKSFLQSLCSFIRCCTGVVLILAPLLAQAQQAAPQTSGGTTRQAEKADLKKLEKNGYQPSANDVHYPQNIQNAERKAQGQAPARSAAPDSGQ